MNMYTTMFDSNAIIGMLTLFVTCIPGIWFLLRCRERRQRLHQQLTQDIETGLSRAVRDAFLNACFALSIPPGLLVLHVLTRLLLSPFVTESSSKPEWHYYQKSSLTIAII